ncbi:chloride channel protein [Bremerella alba]|uniref:H(+)/Cl(-) exchange transporter ClcA n=1 Tax=Bremerella alba TaxID=980252 RepID=A0A7V8V164_9BACT|nr:chloride channel protein [Bremerella alba]MBA2113040.1 H(+)/Cl(-) exchange transporter ClcA [Bremerella alba]
MPWSRVRGWLAPVQDWLALHLKRGTIPAQPLTITLAGIVGILAGYSSIFLSMMIHSIEDWTLRPCMELAHHHWVGLVGLILCPVVGLMLVSWYTRKYYPEAVGHGVPEVVKAIARKDGVIRPPVAIVKLLASGLCIGTGSSIGREGPIVQIGAAFGSTAAQIFQLSARNIKVLAAAGAAAGISATFHAPIAGVIFASEIILGNFAVESLSAIVIAAVLANVVQQNQGDHGFAPEFPHINHKFDGAYHELPSYIFLGIVCGLMAVGFTKLLYWFEDESEYWIPKHWIRSIACGLLLGVIGTTYYVMYPVAPEQSVAAQQDIERSQPIPVLYGTGYAAISHTLHLENAQKLTDSDASEHDSQHENLRLSRHAMWQHLVWLLPLVIVKPFLTSACLAGGGSGGIFAPSLFIGSTTGAVIGLTLNLIAPEWCDHPGAYALVGMGAVVAGTTHGTLSAIVVVYELTDDYRIILPIMAAAGISSLIARWVDPESIYEKKLSRRGESIARSHDLHHIENIAVRDVMVRKFPTVKNTDNVMQIIKIARENPHIESIPVMNEDGTLHGIIRPEDLHRVLDTDISPYLVNAHDIAMVSPIAVSPDENLLEALRDFGTRDVGTLPVEIQTAGKRVLIGLLIRADVMARYREELLKS